MKATFMKKMIIFIHVRDSGSPVPTWLNATVPCDRPGVHIGFVVEVSGASPVAL